MIYLEMSRDEQHGGGTWGFTNCIWSPTLKKGTGGTWPFWEKILEVQEGDTIIHLRGKTPEAHFVGFSTASGNGFRTSKRPPDPGEWDYATEFYRADLAEFTHFHQPVPLNQIFSERRKELEDYFEANKAKGAARANLFFVRQAGKLQCLNGAYLSDIDEELLSILFGDSTDLNSSEPKQAIVSVETGTQIALIRTRLGHSRFASEIKSLYGNHCCFPGCDISDSRFLVASHIARWSDNEPLRGHLGNGLCLCLVHDKAFELGLYTLDENYSVFINPKAVNSDSEIVKKLLTMHGTKIHTARVEPLGDALLEHWIRVDIDPMGDFEAEREVGVGTA